MSSDPKRQRILRTWGVAIVVFLCVVVPLAVTGVQAIEHHIQRPAKIASALGQDTKLMAQLCQWVSSYQSEVLRRAAAGNVRLSPPGDLNHETDSLAKLSKDYAAEAEGCRGNYINLIIEIEPFLGDSDFDMGVRRVLSCGRDTANCVRAFMDSDGQEWHDIETMVDEPSWNRYDDYTTKYGTRKGIDLMQQDSGSVPRTDPSPYIREQIDGWSNGDLTVDHKTLAQYWQDYTTARQSVDQQVAKEGLQR
jgi:hypothetical protein